MMKEDSSPERRLRSKVDEQFHRAFVTLFGFMFLFQSFVTEGPFLLGSLTMAFLMLFFGMWPRENSLYKRVTLENVAKR